MPGSLTQQELMKKEGWAMILIVGDSIRKRPVNRVLNIDLRTN